MSYTKVFVFCSPTSAACARPLGLGQGSGRAGGPGSVHLSRCWDLWTFAMEGSNEPLLNAKAEVSLVREGAGEAGFWSEKDHSLNCVFCFRFRSPTRWVSGSSAPSSARLRWVRGGRQDLALLPLGEAGRPGHPEPSETRLQVEGLSVSVSPWLSSRHPHCSFHFVPGMVATAIVIQPPLPTPVETTDQIFIVPD